MTDLNRHGQAQTGLSNPVGPEDLAVAEIRIITQALKAVPILLKTVQANNLQDRYYRAQQDVRFGDDGYSVLVDMTKSANGLLVIGFMPAIGPARGHIQVVTEHDLDGTAVAALVSVAALMITTHTSMAEYYKLDPKRFEREFQNM